MKKILTCLMIIGMILLIPCACVNVWGSGFSDPTEPNTGIIAPNGSNSVLNTRVGRIWKTLTIVVQVLSLGVVVFAGLRYMFASADKRADIKRGLGYLAIGAMFVFGASTIARFIVNSGKQII